MLRKPNLLTSKFNIQPYTQNTTQKAKRFNKTSIQLLWEDFYESSGRGDEQIGIQNDSDELSPTNEKSSFQTTTGNNCHKNIPPFPKMHLTHKEKKNNQKAPRPPQHYSKELYLWHAL